MDHPQSISPEAAKLRILRSAVGGKSAKDLSDRIKNAQEVRDETPVHSSRKDK